MEPVGAVSYNFYENARNRPARRNNLQPDDLVLHHDIEKTTKRNFTMNSRITNQSEEINRKTSRSICDAVGEQLQQNLRPAPLRPSSHLQHLMDELRRRDNDKLRNSSN
jgi:hypothetical protein